MARVRALASKAARIDRRLDLGKARTPGSMHSMDADDSQPDVTQQPGEADPDQEDETRRRFREALARKQSRGHLGGSTTTSTPHPHAAPAKRGRTFRRKSG